MRDAELYQQLLALTPPWPVTRVALDVAAQRVDVWADAAPGTTWPCPTCGQRLPTYDHAPERAWRHLDSCQFQTFLHARPPRVQCAAHGAHQVRLPWAEPHARFTTLFERFARVVLRGTDVARAAAILRLTWDEAWHLIERAVARGQAAQDRPTPTHLGVDETAIARGPKYEAPARRQAGRDGREAPARVQPRSACREERGVPRDESGSGREEGRSPREERRSDREEGTQLREEWSAAADASTAGHRSVPRSG